MRLYKYRRVFGATRGERLFLRYCCIFAFLNQTNPNLKQYGST